MDRIRHSCSRGRPACRPASSRTKEKEKALDPRLKMSRMTKRDKCVSPYEEIMQSGICEDRRPRRDVQGNKGTPLFPPTSNDRPRDQDLRQDRKGPVSNTPPLTTARETGAIAFLHSVPRFLPHAGTPGHTTPQRFAGGLHPRFRGGRLLAPRLPLKGEVMTGGI